MSLTHYPESSAGPAERRYAVPCQTCHSKAVEATDDCSNCFDPLCGECTVRCAECNSGPYCSTCALRCGFAKRTDDRWFCENCFTEEI